MSQSKRMSALEAATSTGIGLVVAYTTQVIAFPFFGIHGTSTSTHIGLTVIFTGVSLVRGYLVRRLFNRSQERRNSVKSIIERHPETFRKLAEAERPLMFVYRGTPPQFIIDNAERPE